MPLQGDHDYAIAVCADDHCPWKYRGITDDETIVMAQEHARVVDHVVNVYTSNCRQREIRWDRR